MSIGYTRSAKNFYATIYGFHIPYKSMRRYPYELTDEELCIETRKGISWEKEAKRKDY